MQNTDEKVWTLKFLQQEDPEFIQQVKEFGKLTELDSEELIHTWANSQPEPSADICGIPLTPEEEAWACELAAKVALNF